MKKRKMYSLVLAAGLICLGSFGSLAAENETEQPKDGLPEFTLELSEDSKEPEAEELTAEEAVQLGLSDIGTVFSGEESAEELSYRVACSLVEQSRGEESLRFWEGKVYQEGEEEEDFYFSLDTKTGAVINLRRTGISEEELAEAPDPEELIFSINDLKELTSSKYWEEQIKGISQNSPELFGKGKVLRETNIKTISDKIVVEAVFDKKKDTEAAYQILFDAYTREPVEILFGTILYGS